MSEKNDIIQKEQGNDGQSIILFYDDMVGMYVAYVLSAYYTTLAVDPHISYSELLGMPVAMLDRLQVKFLRQSITKVEHLPKSFRKQPILTYCRKK